MDQLFFFGHNRMSELISRVEDVVLRAQLYESLEAIRQAYYNRASQCDNLEKELSRLQSRYNKLKEQQQ